MERVPRLQPTTQIPDICADIRGGASHSLCLLTGAGALALNGGANTRGHLRTRRCRGSLYRRGLDSSTFGPDSDIGFASELEMKMVYFSTTRQRTKFVSSSHHLPILRSPCLPPSLKASLARSLHSSLGLHVRFSRLRRVTSLIPLPVQKNTRDASEHIFREGRDDTLFRYTSRDQFLQMESNSVCTSAHGSL